VTFRPPPSLPAIGDYQHQPVVGPYDVESASGRRDTTYFGRSHKATLVYGTFRAPDGTAFSALRKVGWESASPLTIQATAGDGPFRVRPDTSAAFKGWGVSEAIDDGALVYSSLSGSSGEPFRLTRGADHLAWTEGSNLALTGTLVGGCGIQWYDPSPGGGLYSSEQHRVTGTALGQPVDGFVAFDQLFLPPGVTWFESPYFSSPPYLEIAWNTFATAFDDGSVQAGQVMFGGQRLSFAAIVDDNGPAVFSRDVTADITAGPTGYPTAVQYRIDGVPWRWVAEERWQMPDFARGYPDDTYRPSEGLFMVDGEHRRPVAWWAFLDCWTARRTAW
jgi:hypothetical protein